MPPASMLTLRERFIWLAAFFFIAALIVATRFTSVDADSVRYATISARLSALPVARWVAPEWWGITTPDGPKGYFLEHPAGLFLIPAALGKLGVPPEQAPYIFGVAAGLLTVILSGSLVRRVTTPSDGRAVLVLLQLMPAAFVFRIRDNHEYPMLVCLLVTAIGLDVVTRSWILGLGLVIAGVVGGLLIKGVFVALVLLGGGLWILFNPTGGSRVRQTTACLTALGCMAFVAIWYDAWYLTETGHPFWRAYLQRQLGPVHVAAPITEARAFVTHLGFYAARLLFHPAPWSLALVWAAWQRGALPDGTTPERRALGCALCYTVGSVLVLSVASRFAERYAFSATYMIGAAGAVVAYRWWPTVARWLGKADAAIPALPAVTWLTLVALRLVLGSWLPRIGG